AAALALLDNSVQAGRPFPIIILDGHMPEMDGFTLAERIRQSPTLAGAKLMMLTSSSQKEDIARCKELGVDVYLTKPVRQRELLDALLRVLSGPAASVESSSRILRPRLPAPLRPLRVLVAEDNAVNQQFARGLLRKQGHSVVVVGNGREALDA